MPQEVVHQLMNNIHAFITNNSFNSYLGEIAEKLFGDSCSAVMKQMKDIEVGD